MHTHCSSEVVRRVAMALTVSAQAATSTSSPAEEIIRCCCKGRVRWVGRRNIVEKGRGRGGTGSKVKEGGEKQRDGRGRKGREINERMGRKLVRNESEENEIIVKRIDNVKEG